MRRSPGWVAASRLSHRTRDRARFYAKWRILVLPNAWDTGSARLAESCGAEAIATTSSGVAWAHGRPDGQVLSFADVVGVVAAMARAVKIPISADIEAGYATDARTVGEHVAAVIDAGAVGILPDPVRARARRRVGGSSDVSGLIATPYGNTLRGPRPEPAGCHLSRLPG